ncbi:MAG: hypothetical protein JW837_14590 [Sedimentisphaerales bacterium]|nr:hypothetical protein [Sedimentisphaerales bacterium]
MKISGFGASAGMTKDCVCDKFLRDRSFAQQPFRVNGPPSKERIALVLSRL